MANPSQALPPPSAPEPRNRNRIATELQKALRESNPLVAALPLMAEVLLDIRDLQAECAWRLSEIASATVTPPLDEEISPSIQDCFQAVKTLRDSISAISGTPIANNVRILDETRRNRTV